ncbi:MAG: hypothetical protein K0R38_3376 [Polyangiaceae bacterium]|nr:hypothetical protein [Polyangiaceae bacterium]
MGESVVITAATAENGAASAASLHVALLGDSLIDADQSVELGPGVSEAHLRQGYVQVKRLDLFERRRRAQAPAAPL